MTPRQADQIIKKGEPVTVRSLTYNETFTAVFISRDRWNIRTADGLYDRGDLEIVEDDNGLAADAQGV
jgi:hypothetical protein